MHLNNILTLTLVFARVTIVMFGGSSRALAQQIGLCTLNVIMDLLAVRCDMSNFRTFFYVTTAQC